MKTFLVLYWVVLALPCSGSATPATVNPDRDECAGARDTYDVARQEVKPDNEGEFASTIDKAHTVSGSSNNCIAQWKVNYGWVNESRAASVLAEAPDLTAAEDDLQFQLTASHQMDIAWYTSEHWSRTKSSEGGKFHWTIDYTQFLTNKAPAKPATYGFRLLWSNRIHLDWTNRPNDWHDLWYTVTIHHTPLDGL